ncbi:MAG: tetratricopeptide repeat protein [Chthoniobacteraceae bacterium]
MLRRLFILTLGLWIAVQPAQADTWLQRYLRERRAKDDAKKAVVDDDTNPGEEVRRPEPVNPQDVVDPTAADTTATPAPASIPSEERVLVPTPVNPVPVATPEPVRRAQPVATPQEIGTPAVITRQAPTPAPSVRPRSTPPATATVVVNPTAASPTPAAAAATPQPAETPRDEMDPKTEVIRIAPSNQQQAPDLAQFNYANGFYVKKDFSRAAAEYDRYLTSYPTGADRQAALFRMAESHRQLQNFNAARRTYEQLVLDYRQGDFVGPASFRLAELCFQDKSYPDALAYYRKASVELTDPSLILSAKYNAARCQEALRASSEAIEDYAEVIKTPGENPYRDASRLSTARLLADMGRRKEAVAQYETLIAETTRPAVKAEATVREGLLLPDMGEADKAITVLKKAIQMPEVGPWRETAAVGLLRAAYNAQKYADVLTGYKDGTFSDDAKPEVLLIVANSNRQLGKDKEARDLYESLVRDFPNSSYAKEAQYGRLISLYNTNAPELVQEVDNYLAQTPDATDKRDQLTLLKAEALYKTKNYAAAAPLYASLEDSLLKPTLKAEARFKQGWCSTQAQPRDNAGTIKAFTAFLKEYPTHKLAPTALAQRALSYQQTNNLKAAQADFDQIISRYPQATKEQELAYEQKALILGQQNDNQGMSDTFAALVRKYPKSPAAGKANYWIGWAACTAKNYKEAIKPLQTARQLDKEHFGEKASRLLLQALRAEEDRQGMAEEVTQSEANKVKIPAEYLRWLGTEFYNSGNVADSEKYLARLTAQATPAELQPEDWLMLGSARAKQSKWADSEKSLKTYLGKVTEPAQQATGYLALGETQLGARDFEAASKSADSALSLQPEGRLNAQGRMLSGDIAMARGDFPAAAKLYLSISVVFGDDREITPKALAQAYVAYKKAGDTPQSAKTLNQLQSRYPEYPVPKAN